MEDPSGTSLWCSGAWNVKLQFYIFSYLRFVLSVLSVIGVTLPVFGLLLCFRVSFSGSGLMLVLAILLFSAAKLHIPV